MTRSLAFRFDEQTTLTENDIMNVNPLEVLSKRTAWFAVLALAANCGSRTDNLPRGTDSSSHWLATCDADAACPSGQSCLCGVCTRECDETRDCRSLGEDAVCIDVEGCSRGQVCTRDGILAPAETTPEDAPDATLTSTCDNETCRAQCELVLEAASADAPCLGNDAQCAQFQNEDVQRRVTLVLADTDADDAPYTNDELEARRDCVASWLTEQGSRPSAGADLLHVEVTSEWSAIAPLIASAGLVGYDVSCADCSYCWELREEEACKADAFCMPYMARQDNDQFGCLHRPAMRVCLAADVACDDAITVQGDSAGNCFIFDRGCPVAGLSVGSEYCDFWFEGYLDSFSDEHDSCEDPPYCSGPDAPKLAFETGRDRCDCEHEGSMVCNADTLFTCNNGKWDAGFDGICEVPAGRCDRTFATLAECLEAEHDCLVASEEGAPVCGVERPTSEDSARPRFDAEQCEAIGGTLSEYSNDVWVNMPSEDQYCLVADWLTGEQCAAVEGNVRCIVGTSGSFCRNDETPIVQLSNCQSGAGYCCVPDATEE